MGLYGTGRIKRLLGRKKKELELKKREHEDENLNWLSLLELRREKPDKETRLMSELCSQSGSASGE